MSYKSVGASIASVDLQSGNKINLNTTNINADTFEYEEIDYSQDIDTNIQIEEYETKKEPTKLTYTEEVQGLLNILNQEIADLDSKIEPLQEEYDTAMITVRNPVWFNPNNVNGKASDTCERIRPELDALKGQKAMLESYVYQMENELALAPYREIANTNDYINFIKDYTYNYQNIDYDLLIQCNYDPMMYIMEISRGKSRAELDEMLADRKNQIDKIAIAEYIIDIAPKDKSLDELTYMFPHLTDGFINYQFMTKEQRDMYHYIFAKKGEAAANEYLEVISDSVNQAYGAKLAADFINTLDLDDKGKLEKNLANFFGVSTKGLSDGIDTFFAGIENVFVNNEKLTAEEYEKMIVLQYLSENSNYYDEIYTFNSSLGNMLPSMATSAIVSLLATPAAGAVTGSVLMGTSAGGNAKHQALVEGNSLLSSWIYGIFVGSSEAALGYFLGKIPGISKVSGFTLKNLLCEGTEEFLQEWIDAGLQAVILGKDVDWSKIPKQSIDSFVMGVLMSGFLNGGQAIVNISINGFVQEINIQKTLSLLEQNPNMSCYDAMLQANGIDPLSITDPKQYLEVESLVSNQDSLVTELDSYCHETEISAQASLDSTAVMISVKQLQSLLLSDEALNKFNNFESNRDFFKFSKEYYVVAIEQYYQILQKNGFNFTKEMQTRYDTIMAQSSKISSFSEVIGSDTYSFSLYGKNMSYLASYFDSMIFDENNYNRFLKVISNFTGLNDKLIDLTAPFYAIHQLIKQKLAIIDPVAEQRLIDLSKVYADANNVYGPALSQYSYYGADQHAIQNIANNPAANPVLYAQVEAIAKSYFPKLSKAQINRLLRVTDTEGICSYATVINEILVRFNNNPDAFKQCFGYDMYRMENGQKVLNDELILTDLFCYANQNNPGIIKRGLFGFKIAKNDKGQNYMSLGMSTNSKNVAAINGWLQSKGINGSWQSQVLYMTPSGNTAPTAAYNITGKIQQALLSGHTVELDVFSDSNKPMDLVLHSPDIRMYSDYKLSGAHSFGHSMAVTGITIDGDLIVASWGREYIIKWTELANVGITINESNLQ